MRASRQQESFWATLDRPVKLRRCDCPGCEQAGDFRAPRTRDLKDYYWFCLDHVRQYNASWDYLAGFSEAEIENHIRNSTVWERPTWPLGDWHQREQQLRENVAREFFDEDGSEAETRTPPAPMSLGEREALMALELNPPVTFAAVKAQYRLLVKRHHPDANGGSRAAEEKFKIINHAFAVLREIYEEVDDNKG